MKPTHIQIVTPAGRRDAALTAYLSAEDEERSAAAEYDWIKQLRGLPVDGEPLRRRFTFRGDSLWWFTELYLHKTEVVRDLFRLAFAVENLIAQESPSAIGIVSGGNRLARGVASQIAGARRIGWNGERGFGPARRRLLQLELRASGLTYSALGSRARPRDVPRRRAPIAAFVHRAFWRGDTGDGSAESYIGPVLHALESRMPPEGVQYVAVGPASNFAARRWWHSLRHSELPAGITPVEAYAPLAALRPSMDVWRARRRWLGALLKSSAVRDHAVVNGIDWWPAIREELAGVAFLQWPWSARVMDEAGAALDVIGPDVALTYAEAGGWGRALMLEARRRGVRSVGLQHGFIYRHWLNYRHEPDEMRDEPETRGFPRPDLTLLFDGYAAEHLQAAGRFPPDAVSVTGSPRLDALVATARQLDERAVASARAEAGVDAGRPLVLCVTKFREARHVLPRLIDAVRHMDDVRLAIKPHPAETPDVYRGLAAGVPRVTVLGADSPLAPLIAAARAIVTVNSTVALDAAVLGVPTLVIGLPNNLTPFVEAGVMAGATDGEVGTALGRILYDEGFRRELESGRSVFLERYGIAPDGRAAERSAAAILAVRDRRR